MNNHETPSPVRYSQAQVLCGLREVWRRFNPNAEPFESSTLLVEYMRADDSWEELFLFIDRIEQFFQLRPSQRDWLVLLGWEEANRSESEWEEEIVPTLTFGSLARFIAERADGISLSPAVVLGKDSAPAGAFLGIQQLAARTTGRNVAIGPSTRILDVLRGDRLDRFWTQLRWISEDSIPSLPASWREAPCQFPVLGLIGLVVGVVVYFVVGAFGILVAGVFKLAASGLLGRLFKYMVNPLPEGIVSFRDLAFVLAEGGCSALQGRPAEIDALLGHESGLDPTR